MQDMISRSSTAVASLPPVCSVWIVDDTPAVLLLASHAFTRAGWRVTEFEDLHSARTALATLAAPDAVVLDVHLPDGSGLDEVSVFAAAGSAVMVVSNLAGGEHRQRALASGAFDIATKPLDMRKLVEQLDGAVGRHHLLGGTSGTGS